MGSTILAIRNIKNKVTSRLRKASTSFTKLNNTWTSKIYSTKAKLRIFNSNVSVLTYGFDS